MKNKAQEITLYACGDICLYGTLGKKILDEGPAAVFGEVKSVLEKEYLFVANLECPMTHRGAPIKAYPPHLRSDPKMTEALTYLGIDVVNLANNHLMDFGSVGFSDTIETLSKSNIEFFGCGEDDRQLHTSKIISFKKVRVAFLGYNDWPPVAGRQTPGAFPLKERKIISEIQSIREKADFIVLSLHFGYEYCEAPSPNQVSMCRRLIDAGADVILGHHPHILQGFERYGHGLIFYSLGNFAFFSGMTIPERCRRTLLIRLQLAKKGKIGYSLIPFRFDESFTLRHLTSDEKAQAVSGMEHLSRIVADRNLLLGAWYETVRTYMMRQVKSIWLNTVKRARLFYPITWPLSFLTRSTKRQILIWSIKFFFSGRVFINEYKRISKKINADTKTGE